MVSRSLYLNLEPHPCLMADTSSLPPLSLKDIEALVLEVFSRVWEEFNAADAEYCETTIGSLAAPSVAQDTTCVVKSESIGASPRDMNHLVSRASCVVISTSGSSILHIPRVCRETNVQTFILPPAVEPCTQYESWTPTNRSIFRGDDSDDMQFLPFADEHAFNKEAYGKFFKTLAWQGSERLDAECELFIAVFFPLFEIWLGHSGTSCSRGCTPPIF
jgi:hypothetical protein